MQELQKNTANIISKLGTSRTQYEIPINWSINKYKCLLTTQISSLNFDQFEICFQQKLLRGSVKIFQLVEMVKDDESIQLQIIKAKSETKLNEYYEANIKKFMEISAYENQPILSNQYQKYLNLISKEEKVEAHPQAFEERVQEQAEMPLILRLLKFVGIFSLAKLIFSTSFKMIAIIASIIIVYLIVDAYVKTRHKKAQRSQNNGKPTNIDKDLKNKKIQEMQNGENEEKPQNRRKGIILLYYYKIIEIVFCFFFTIFPNFTIDMHLQINKDKILKARQSINELIPQTFDQGPDN